MYRNYPLMRGAVWRRNISAVLLCCGAADAALAAAPAPLPVLPAVVRSFSALSRHRPVSCDAPAAPAPAGWVADPAQCAWQQRLTMRRWVLGRGATPACVSPQAAWWHWQQQRDAAAGNSPVWDAGWRRQVILQEQAGDGASQVFTLIAQTPDGAWTATTWRWNAPVRRATRAWEQQRWLQLKQALLQLADSDNSVAPRSPLGLGYRNLRNRPAERSDTGLVWQADSQCMHLVLTPATTVPDIALPYVREDSRLEQRAAMQVQLARTAASQTWPAVFHLMPPVLPHQRSATYAAISRRGAQLTGHVWLPAKDDKALHLHIETTLDATPGSPGEARVVSALDRELAGIAALWVVDHER